MVNGELISKTNHQPLVDEELFLYAFTRLSTYTIDGQINEERICLKPQRRFCQRETEQQYFGGLLKDRITTLNGSVHVHPDKGNYRYVRMLPSKVIREADTGIKVSIIDTAFTDRFFERLKETHDFDQYHKWLAEETSKQEALVVSVTEQLQQIDKQQEAMLDERLAIRK